MTRKEEIISVENVAITIFKVVMDSSGKVSPPVFKIQLQQAHTI